MSLKYENYYLRDILFQTLKQYSSSCLGLSKARCKDPQSNYTKMKSGSPIKVVKNKRKCFQLFLNPTRTLVLRAYFLRARWGTKVKLCVQKIERNELNLSRCVNEFFQNVQNVEKRWLFPYLAITTNATERQRTTKSGTALCSRQFFDFITPQFSLVKGRQS